VTTDYSALSLDEVRAGLDAVGQEAAVEFGGLAARQLNWRPDDTRWSVAQCFEHMVTANGLLMMSSEAALTGSEPRTVWQRLPGVPGLLGRMLIRSQAPGGTRRFTAPSKAQPAASDIAADIIPRFVAQHRDVVVRLRALDEPRAARTIMTSPFARVITYSVLDGFRLMLTHDRRHVEQARRVRQAPGFPE
jgi:hypothetical protein